MVLSAVVGQGRNDVLCGLALVFLGRVPEVYLVLAGSTALSDIFPSNLFLEEKGEITLEFLEGFKTFSAKMIVTRIPTGVLLQAFCCDTQVIPIPHKPLSVLGSPFLPNYLRILQLRHQY